MYKDTNIFVCECVYVLVCEHINMYTQKRTNSYVCMYVRGKSDVTRFSLSFEDEN